jgi:AcrR family transcriptional regulator
MFLEFAFMPSSAPLQIEPRKQPVQGRSTATVEALYQASIQVLLELGYRKLTTTRVAERAGVSVGSLYQYFPNREALIAAVIARHLESVLAVVERQARALRGRRLSEIVCGLVDAVVAAKAASLDISRALQEPLAEMRGAQCVHATTLKMAQPLAEVLRSCRDARFKDAEKLAVLTVVACSALLQMALTDAGPTGDGALDMESLRAHMRAMVLGYLREMRVRTAR